MSAKLGGYFADRGGMFMSATLRQMARPRTLRVVEEKQLYRFTETVDGPQRVAAGVERVERVEVCLLSRREIHALSMGGSAHERQRHGRGSR